MSKDSISLRKFLQPSLASTVLRREALMNKLHGMVMQGREGDGACLRMILLCAPAGYGKTTLLTAFAKENTRKWCWYFLEQADADGVIFLQSLLASIRVQIPSFGLALDSLIAEAAAETADASSRLFLLESLVDKLAQAMDAEIQQDVLLCLCNYEVIGKQSLVNHLVTRLLQKIPLCCTLIIESRAIPNLEFIPFLIRQEIGGLSLPDFRFTAQELYDLVCLQKNISLTMEEAERITHTFEGWIGGILLGTVLGGIPFWPTKLSLQSRTHPPSFSWNKAYLFEYVVQSIFKSDARLYSFFKEAVVLEHMTVLACKNILGHEDTDELLQEMEKRGWFVESTVVDVHTIYTCHPIIREILLDELKRSASQRFVELHQLAAHFFRVNGDFERAIGHAFEALDEHMAAGLLVEVYEEVLGKGYVETVERWMKRFSMEIIKVQPELLLIQATLDLLRGEHQHTLELIDTAYTLLTEGSPVVGGNDRLGLKIQLLRSKALFQSGAYYEAQQVCLLVLDDVPDSEQMLLAETYARLGVCANFLGKFHLGLKYFQKALYFWKDDLVCWQVAELHGFLASTYSLMGDFVFAEYHVTRSMTYWNFLPESYGKVTNLIRIALVKHRQGALMEVEAFLMQALSIIRGGLCFPRGEAYVLVSLSDLYQDQGKYDRALVVVEEGLVLARQLKDLYLINCGLCTAATTSLLMNNISAAKLLLAEVTLPVVSDHLHSYEKILYDITMGTILFCQKYYNEAITTFMSLDPLLRTMGLFREVQQVMIRLASCYALVEQNEKAVQIFNEMMKMRDGEFSQQFLSLEMHKFEGVRKALELVSEVANFLGKKVLEVKEDQMNETKVEKFEALTSVSIQSRQIVVLAFGEPMVQIEGVSITTWRMLRAKELFFLLLDGSQPISKDHIVTALWPEFDEKSDSAFHSTMHYLRKRIGKNYIFMQKGNYMLDLSREYGTHVLYDVTIFREKYQLAKQALHSKDDAEAKSALLEMVDLYKGVYLQSFYSDWCVTRRDELRRIYLDARHQLGLLTLRDNLIDESIVHWKAMLTLDACLEEAHCGLMQCYLRQGKRGNALRQYQICVDTLWQEYAVKPGAMIQKFCQKYLQVER